MVSTEFGFERHVMSALDASPSRVPVILGPSGSGRSSLLQRLRTRQARGAIQYVNVERCATTPERFLHAVASTSPYPLSSPEGAPATARGAFDAWLGLLKSARAGGGEPATFLLDEVMAFCTFESFPGLRHVMADLLTAIATSPNRFVLTSRYASRAHQWLRDAPSRFELVVIPAMTPADVRAALSDTLDGGLASATEDRDAMAMALAAHALTAGRPVYVAAVASAMAALGRGSDPVTAFAELLAPDGALTERCATHYELRLQQARGYGALKAILDILAEHEPLTLTEISQRLRRTPGSTKDYLSWLEDVDLVAVRQKRYTFTDPVLRVWVRLYCRPVPPTAEDVVREVWRYALTRIPTGEPTPELEYAQVGTPGDDRKSWGIIEID